MTCVIKTYQIKTCFYFRGNFLYTHVTYLIKKKLQERKKKI